MAPKSSDAASKKKAAPTKKAAGGPKKAASGYQVYMKDALAKMKTDFPDMEHKERFSKAAKAWKTHPSNPKKA